MTTREKMKSELMERALLDISQSDHQSAYFNSALDMAEAIVQRRPVTAIWDSCGNLLSHPVTMHGAAH